MRINSHNLATALALKTVAFVFNTLPRYRAHLNNSEGWIDFAVGIRTEDGSVEQAFISRGGRVWVKGTIPADVDVVMQARDRAVLKEMATVPPNEMLVMMLRNKITVQGNLAYLQLFNYYLSLLVGGRQQRILDRVHQQDMTARKAVYGVDDPQLAYHPPWLAKNRKLGAESPCSDDNRLSARLPEARRKACIRMFNAAGIALA